MLSILVIVTACVYFLRLGAIVSDAAHVAHVSQEKPDTALALKTMYFMPFENSPNLSAIKHRHLDLSDHYTTNTTRFEEEIAKLEDAFAYLVQKHNTPHPCTEYYRASNAMDCKTYGFCVRNALYYDKSAACAEYERTGVW